MGPADHTEFLGPQIYTLTTDWLYTVNSCSWGKHWLDDFVVFST